MQQQLNPDDPNMQTMQLDSPVRATQVTLRILTTITPEDRAFDFTPISEIDVEGQ